MATATLRDHIRDIRRGKPGHRFEDHYRHEKAAKRGRSTGRVVLLLLGIASVIGGLILCVIPGPGLPFIFIGGGLLATESLFIARIMDWFELRVRAVVRWGKRHWARMNGWQRVGVVILGACLGVAGAYLSWRLMFG